MQLENAAAHQVQPLVSWINRPGREGKAASVRKINLGFPERIRLSLTRRCFTRRWLGWDESEDEGPGTLRPDLGAPARGGSAQVTF
jgi:hypothetical protein